MTTNKYFFQAIHCTISLLAILLCGLSFKYEYASVNQCTYYIDKITGTGSVYIDKFKGAFAGIPFDFDLRDQWHIPLPSIIPTTTPTLFPSGGSSDGGGSHKFIDSDEVRQMVIRSFIMLLVAIGLLVVSIFPSGTLLYRRMPAMRFIFFLPIPFIVASVSIFLYQVGPWFRKNLFCDVSQSTGITMAYVALGLVSFNALIIIVVWSLERNKTQEDTANASDEGSKLLKDNKTWY
ncbi:hypothetical protein SAMD00019534_087070 [Acytostelium subglobosum LB1]|uniref:hypothetical protein n=1 Tax=Acytostelium subglobosum LB1 TaxID=1410327 RepID=UPI000644DAB8|nr:hypothetical protein SAMD00019534_087070 [Acytostelium subglobosum LB1]GAM25532.1 hypothetical protein SAMD00019534_087070 [Acytostelium subglobosum LB1]|eukprot:XP_012751518.1 hypothetical protein SAMD00019534_087070 [Acytostelium subglobosum LB1]